MQHKGPKQSILMTKPAFPKTICYNVVWTVIKDLNLFFKFKSEFSQLHDPHPLFDSHSCHVEAHKGDNLMTEGKDKE